VASGAGTTGCPTRAGHGSQVAVLSYAGEIVFMRLENLPFGPLVTTLIQRGDGPQARCPACLRAIECPANLIDAIGQMARDARLSPSESPCACLPFECWDEPRLVFACNECGALLKANPFIVDSGPLIERLGAAQPKTAMSFDRRLEYDASKPPPSRPSVAGPGGATVSQRLRSWLGRLRK
jgi:hypothetical protein